MAQIIGIDVGGEMLELEDFVEIKRGEATGRKGHIKAYRDGKVFVETLKEEMIETEARCLKLIEHAAKVITQ